MQNISSFNYPVLDPEATGARIRELRLRNGIKVKEIEDNCFLTSPRVIYKWEKGYCLPAIENLLALSRMFGVSIEDLLVEKEKVIPLKDKEDDSRNGSNFGRRDEPDRPLFIFGAVSSKGQRAPAASVQHQSVPLTIIMPSSHHCF